MEFLWFKSFVEYSMKIWVNVFPTLFSFWFFFLSLQLTFFNFLIFSKKFFTKKPPSSPKSITDPKPDICYIPPINSSLISIPKKMRFVLPPEAINHSIPFYFILLIQFLKCKVQIDIATQIIRQYIYITQTIGIKQKRQKGRIYILERKKTMQGNSHLYRNTKKK